MQTVNHLCTIPLQYTGICHILAVTDQQTIIVEEYYANHFVAQHHIEPPDRFIITTDEKHGQSCLVPIPTPAGSAVPPTTNPIPKLEHRTGAPQHGIRADDRIDSLVYPLTMSDKIRLAEQVPVPAPPPMLIGLSESRVLSNLTLPNDHRLICRHLRLAYALMTEKTLPSGQRINYNTVTIHRLQFLPDDESFTPLTLTGLYTDEHLHRPTQCMRHGDRIYIADSGGDQPNRVHIYHVQTNPKL